jgi:hypothetical protein
MSESPAPKPRIDIDLPAGLEAIYANLVLLTHSPSEVIIDFAQLFPQTPHARVKARVVMTPLNAKRLLRALAEQLSRFETRFGEIVIPPKDGGLADQLFHALGPDKPEGE